MGWSDISWMIIVVVAFMAALPLLRARKDPARQKAALDDYATKVNLTITPEVQPRVLDRIRAYERFTVIGAVVGGVLGAAIAFPLHAMSVGGTERDAWSESRPLMIIIGMALGAGYAPTVAALRRTLRPMTGRRVARPITSSVADYVPTLERISAPVGLGCVVLAVVVAWTLFETGLLRSEEFGLPSFLVSPGAVLGYIGLLTWIARIVAERLVLRTSQVAGSEQELAWDDAFRSMTLRGMASMPFMVSVPAVILLFFQVVRQAGDVEYAMATAGVVVLFGYVAILASAIAINMTRAPAQHYWRRLWAQRQGEPA